MIFSQYRKGGSVQPADDEEHNRDSHAAISLDRACAHIPRPTGPVEAYWKDSFVLTWAHASGVKALSESRYRQGQRLMQFK